MAEWRWETLFALAFVKLRKQGRERERRERRKRRRRKKKRKRRGKEKEEEEEEEEEGREEKWEEEEGREEGIPSFVSLIHLLSLDITRSPELPLDSLKKLLLVVYRIPLFSFFLINCYNFMWAAHAQPENYLS